MHDIGCDPLAGIVQAAPINAPEPQRSFASAEDAAKAFVAALRDNNKTDLRAILGPEADRVVDSGDRYGDQELHQRFVALYEEKHAIDEKVPGRAELNVGANDWPLPIPLVESNGRWISTRMRVPRRSSTAASGATSCQRSVHCSPAQMLSTIISIAPSRQTAGGLRNAPGEHARAPRWLVLAGRRGRD